MMSSLKDLYIHQLRDLYSAETQLVDALPKMANAATSSELKEAFQSHLRETERHVSRLREIFNRHHETPEGETCEAMEGLIKEGEQLLSEWAEPEVRDAALIAAAQRVEHYEMAGYGAVRTFADCLDLSDDKKILQDTLDEEGKADHLLTKIATGGTFGSGINKEAVHARA